MNSRAQRAEDRIQNTEVRSQKFPLKKCGSYYRLLSYCLLFTVYCLLFLTGCGSTPVTLSDMHLKAIDINQNGEKAFKRGDYKTSLKLYSDALRTNRSIENIDGIAINLMNLATVHRKLGERDNALQCVDEILNSSSLSFTQHRLSEASYLKAILYLDNGQMDTSLEWSDKALSFCQQTKCGTEGRIYNLKAKISLLKQELDNALLYGAKGLDFNKSFEDNQEIANSIRLMAEAKTAKKEYLDARKLYEEAMQIDKALGLTNKIAFDLVGIGQVFLHEGKKEEALRYFKRALSISESSGDAKGIADVKNIIEKVRK